MRSLYVPLSPDAQARLRELAAAERRSTKQQAAILLERALAPAQPKAAERHAEPAPRIRE